jgi:hypothetical protein
MLSPGIVALLSATWLCVSLVLFSDPGGDFVAAYAWVLFSVAMFVAWLVLLGITYQVARASHWSVPRRIGLMVGYMLPLPIAVVILVALLSNQIPMKARFALSEPALNDYVRTHTDTGLDDKTERAGLYKIDFTYQREGCLILETAGANFTSTGFAYCTGDLPDEPDQASIEMDHLTGNWWTYSDFD